MEDFITLLEELKGVLSELSQIFGGISGIFGDIEGTVGGIESIVVALGVIFSAIATIATVLSTAIPAIVSFLGTVGGGALIIGVCIVLILGWLAIQIVQAIPIFILAKRNGCKCAWLAFLPILLPILEEVPRTFLITEIPGDKEVTLIKKMKIESRTVAFWIWLGVYAFECIFCDTIAYSIDLFAVALIPIAVLIGLIPSIILGWFEYAFIRDILNMYKPNKKANTVIAIVVAVVDNFIPYRFARTVCLYGLLKSKSLPEECITEVEYKEEETV